MGNFIPGICSYTFDMGYQYDSRTPFYADIKLFSDDPRENEGILNHLLN
jgi:hypothetical protein